MTRRDKLCSFCTLLSSRGGGPDDMRRQIMVIPHTFLPFRPSCFRWRAETKFGHSTPFCHPEAAGPMTRGDLHYLPHSQDLSYWLLSHADGRKYPSGYPYKHSFAICKKERLIACRDWHRLLHLLFPRDQQVICMRKFYGHPRLSSTERNEISVIL